MKRVVILGGSLIALRTVSKAPSNIDFHLIERDLERIKAVSYTHLDVYKRQVISYTCSSATGTLTRTAPSSIVTWTS